MNRRNFFKLIPALAVLKVWKHVSPPSAVEGVADVKALAVANAVASEKSMLLTGAPTESFISRRDYADWMESALKRKDGA